MDFEKAAENMTIRRAADKNLPAMCSTTDILSVDDAARRTRYPSYRQELICRSPENLTALRCGAYSLLMPALRRRVQN